MEQDSQTKKLKCGECRRAIGYGGDLITAEKGVSGPRGVVPLGEKRHFCSEACLSNYYGNSDLSELPSMPPRIP
jgi:hypothetical protein